MPRITSRQPQLTKGAWKKIVTRGTAEVSGHGLNSATDKRDDHSIVGDVPILLLYEE